MASAEESQNTEPEMAMMPPKTKTVINSAIFDRGTLPPFHEPGRYAVHMIGPAVDFASGVRLYDEWFRCVRETVSVISSKGASSVSVMGRGSPSVHTQLGAALGTGLPVFFTTPEGVEVQLHRFTKGPLRTQLNVFEFKTRCTIWPLDLDLTNKTDELVFFTTQSRAETFMRESADAQHFIVSPGVHAKGASANLADWVFTTISTPDQITMTDEGIEEVAAEIDHYTSYHILTRDRPGSARRGVRRIFLLSSLPLAFSLQIGCSLRANVQPAGVEFYLVDRVGTDYYCAGRLL